MRRGHRLRRPPPRPAQLSPSITSRRWPKAEPNTLDNIVPAHRGCNRNKSDKDLDELLPVASRS
ncbi:hypothetical protein I541_5670 [Mycobacteroides abscessus]|nr:hypothetical protein I541_5670 [Mycobacteroides abscessus]